MNHAGTQDIDPLVIIRIIFQFPVSSFQLTKDVILGSYLTFPIRPYRSRHHIFSQHIPHHTVCSGFYRTEENELPCRRFHKVIEYPLRQFRIDIKISLGSCLILRIMGLACQMNDGIKPRKILHQKRSRLNIFPRKSLYHSLLLRCDNIQPIKIMTLL